MLSDTYDFRDQLQPQGILSAALKPSKRGAA